MAKGGINRSISIPQADVFGRIGTGIGKGISEQLPKEMERNRLGSALENLGNQKDLSRFQQFTGLVKAAHEYPQIVQSGSDLLRQQEYLDSIKKQYQETEGSQGTPQRTSQNYAPTQEDLEKPLKGETQTLATPEATAQSYKKLRLPTKQQERKDAAANFNENPARYDYNFDKALDEREKITKRDQEIQQNIQDEEKLAVDKEKEIKGAFDNEAKRLGIVPIGDNANFHPKMYQKFEGKVINAMLSKAEGGEGLSQEDAIKKYSDSLESAFKNYQNLQTLSTWSPSDFNRRANAIQKSFADLDALPILEDELIANYQVSPMYAGHKAYPIKNGEVPTLNKLGPKIGASASRSGYSIPKVTNATYEQLKKEMGKTHSPLSIAYELQEKHQDPRPWLKYLSDHRENLQVWQADELSKNINVLDLKDKWLRLWE